MKPLYVFISTILLTLTGYSEEQQELKTFEKVLELMNEHYYDATYNGLDWQKLTLATREKIKNSSTSADKYQHIVDLFKKLGHSHLDFHPPTRKKNKEPQIPSGNSKTINFQLEKIDGKWLVSSVISNSDAWKAGLRPGFTVTKLNKWLTADLYVKSKAMSFYYMQRALERYPEKTIVVSGINHEGQKATVSWRLSAFKGKVERMGNISKRTEIVTKILPGNIGYVSFNIYLIGPAMQTIKAIKKFRDLNCAGIIIDLRNNPGGIGALSSAIAKEFCQKNYNLGSQKGRDSVLNFPVYVQPKPYKGKVAIIINKYSASTSEVMAAGIQTNKSATIIGETSAGMALPSVIVNFEDGSVFQYPVADFKTVDGKEIEGIGVIPDIKVSHTLESLQEGKDIFIEEAIKYLNKK
jgi:carboxyl-terminal processing protease